MKGTVTWFNAEKGYGIIKIDGGEERTFIDRNNIEDEIKVLHDGYRVEFDLIDSDSKPGKKQAVNIRGYEEES